jgi:hypothetical protein
MPALGAGGLPVQIRAHPPKHLAYFLGLIKIPLHPVFLSEILADRRFGFASRLIPKTSLHDEFAKNGKAGVQFRNYGMEAS